MTRYAPKDKLNTKAFEGPLSELTGLSLHNLRGSFEPQGFSGRVTCVEAETDAGQLRKFIVKQIPDQRPWDFYRDLLLPLRLDTPKMYGTFKAHGKTYLVLDFIEHQPVDWEDPNFYLRAVDGLAYKDNMVRRHLDWISRLSYIEAFEYKSLDSHLANVEKGVRLGYDSHLTRGFSERLRRHAGSLRQLSQRLRNGTQTLVHNDYQLLNILLPKDDWKQRVYIVDWTYPCLGSITIDLASLLHVAPPSLRATLLERYRIQVRPEGLEDCLPAAKAYVALSKLSWMVDAFEENQGHAVSRTRLRECVFELENFCHNQSPQLSRDSA